MMEKGSAIEKKEVDNGQSVQLKAFISGFERESRPLIQSR